jgi:hypothetical protein
MQWISGDAPPLISTSCCKMSDAWHETRTHWAPLRTLVQKRIGEDGVICIPTTTTSGIAPRLEVESNMAGFTRPTLCLMSIADVAGLCRRHEFQLWPGASVVGMPRPRKLSEGKLPDCPRGRVVPLPKADRLPSSVPCDGRGWPNIDVKDQISERRLHTATLRTG